jgi:hypothetical protein
MGRQDASGILDTARRTVSDIGNLYSGRSAREAAGRMVDSAKKSIRSASDRMGSAASSAVRSTNKPSSSSSKVRASDTSGKDTSRYQKKDWRKISDSRPAPKRKMAAKRSSGR